MHSKELWLVQKNHATVKLVSKGFLWNENLQQKKWTAKSNLKENAEQPYKLKSLHVALNIAGVERTRSKNGQHWRPFDSSFEWKEP